MQLRHINSHVISQLIEYYPNMLMPCDMNIFSQETSNCNPSSLNSMNLNSINFSTDISLFKTSRASQL